ncbi:MAG: hypothetical protein CMH32_05705 [Micavibrio sp.]|nr:hypothetical protein [Micavibrio sp.]
MKSYALGPFYHPEEIEFTSEQRRTINGVLGSLKRVSKNARCVGDNMRAAKKPMVKDKHGDLFTSALELYEMPFKIMTYQEAKDLCGFDGGNDNLQLHTDFKIAQSKRVNEVVARIRKYAVGATDMYGNSLRYRDVKLGLRRRGDGYILCLAYVKQDKSGRVPSMAFHPMR